MQLLLGPAPNAYWFCREPTDEARQARRGRNDASAHEGEGL